MQQEHCNTKARFSQSPIRFHVPGFKNFLLFPPPCGGGNTQKDWDFLNREVASNHQAAADIRPDRVREGELPGQRVGRQGSSGSSRRSRSSSPVAHPPGRQGQKKPPPRQRRGRAIRFIPLCLLLPLALVGLPPRRERRVFRGEGGGDCVNICNKRFIILYGKWS